MSDLKKRRQEDEDSSEDECIVEDMGTDDDQEEEDEEMEVNEQVQVDFEGFSILDHDFHGLRQMLQQLFPKDNIDVSDIANILIEQNFLGTALKQSEVEEDESDDDDDAGQVLGVTSCVSCNGMHKQRDSVTHLMKFLLQNCDKFATDEKTKTEFKKILLSKKEETCLGWIINERLINIPPQISLPMFEKLQLEMGEAQNGKHKNCYKFSHYMMICKTFRTATKGADDKAQGEILQFINSEEELFCEESYAKFTYPLDGAAGLIAGKWDEDSEEIPPSRTVLLISKDGVLKAMDKLRHHLSASAGQ